MEASIRASINHSPQLSPTFFEQLSGCTTFKVNFHCISIHVRKDPEHKWYDIPYLVMDDSIVAVLDHWSVEWRMASDLSVGSSKSAGKQKKEEAQSRMQQLAKKMEKGG